MTNSIQKTILLLVAVLTFSQCKKEISGCTDPNATNYNYEANQNCCCSYSGTVTFWNYNFNVGTISVNIGSESHIISDDVEPFECSVSGCANFYDLPYGTYTYSATSSTGETWGPSTFTLSGNCLLFHLQ